MALQINKRERAAIVLGLAIIFLALIYHLGIQPFMENQEKTQRQWALKTQTLQTLVELDAEYKQIQGRNKNLGAVYGQREKDFTLFAFLEKLAAKSGVNTHLDYMKPSSSMDKETQMEISIVEMRLKGIKLSQLMDYLYRVETSPNIVFVRGLSISRDGKSKRTLSAVLHVETINT